MWQTKMQPQPCGRLLERYTRTGGGPDGGRTRLTFAGVDGRDVYNITAPFETRGTVVIAGRVESRDSEFSEVRFFRQDGPQWRLIEDAPAFTLEDPFVTRVGDEWVFGGVQVHVESASHRIVSWSTQFYRGPDIWSLGLFATGPSHMKDIRLVRLPRGKIGVFTRPQGNPGGRGQIGFFTISSLDQLEADAISAAPLFTDQFMAEEWGGVNEAHVLENGRIGVLGHIACFDAAQGKHYYAMAFGFDPESGRRTPVKIIARRSDFQPGASKSPQLQDVLFSGGLVRRPGGTAVLYCGVGDAEAHCLTIEDPFLEYETC